MEQGKRTLILNWSPVHEDLRRSVEDHTGGPDDRELRNDPGWTYLTFFPPGTPPREVLYDIDELKKLARENHYYLPAEVITQHNKVVLTVYSESDPPVSPLGTVFARIAMFAARFEDTRRFPCHGVYGKFGGVYERPEKGRVLVLYSRREDDLLAVYEAMERLLAEFPAEGFRSVLGFSNGLSAIPRILQGFGDPHYRHSGVNHFRVSDPSRFAMLLDQAMNDHRMYRFAEPAASARTAPRFRAASCPV